MTTLGIIVGSLRQNAYSRQWAENMAKMFPSDWQTRFIEIGDLPLYNEEYDEEGEQTPEAYQRFRQEMSEVDAVLFSTPEYNRTMPASIKNALDVGSRPYGESIWEDKPALIVSHSVSNISGFGANHNIRQALVFLNMPILQQPEVYLANSQDLLENGQINNDGTKDFLQSVVDSYVDFAQKFI